MTEMNGRATVTHETSSGWYQPSPFHQEQRKPKAITVELYANPESKTDSMENVFWEEEKQRTEHSGAKVCLPGRADSLSMQLRYREQEKPPAVMIPKQQVSTATNSSAETVLSENSAPKVVLQNRTVRKRDSLSRLVSAQVCAAILVFLGISLLRMISEPAFMAVQGEIRELLVNMKSVVAVSAAIDRFREEDLEESLRQVLSAGMEKDMENSQHTAIIPAASEPAGGTENLTNKSSGNSSSEDVPDTAAAAGGTYLVSMEQRPFALAAMDGLGNIAGAVCPTEGNLTSGYGPREHPITGQPDFHTGIDIGAPIGTPVYAVAAGVIEKCGISDSLGNYIVVRHSAETITTYSHCYQLLGEEGEAVDRGEVIASVGSTGVSTGPHLHFECISEETITDPSWILEMPLPQ